MFKIKTDIPLRIATLILHVTKFEKQTEAHREKREKRKITITAEFMTFFI